MNHTLADFFEPSMDNIPYGIFQVCVIMGICCVLVMVPLDQWKEASRLDVPAVYILTVLAFVALLQVERFGPWFSILASALSEMLSAYLLHKKRATFGDCDTETESDKKHPDGDMQ